MNQKPNPTHRSFWLEETLRGEAGLATDLPPKQNLSGRADVVIIGGGYVGLWTAIRIKEQEAGARVVILEKDICGGGASGRNGGFALSWWPKISSLVKLCGPTTGLEIAQDSEAAIGELDSFSKAHGFDIEFRRSPWLWTATSSAQMDSWEGVIQFCEKRSMGPFQRLSPEAIARRTGSPAHRAGIVDTSAATLQPAALARGLRQVALKLGVEIFEGTAVRDFTRSNPILVHCESGSVRTEKLIIANNAWAAGIRELSRSIVAITSDMIMSAPAAAELEKIGWTGGECITDSQTMVDYYHVTKSKRVAFGKGGWGIAFGGNLGRDFDRNQNRARMVEADFRRYYPSLKNVPITHDWCGPIDRTPNSLPLLGTLSSNPNIFYGVGWSGNGVGPSVIGGRVLASLALGKKDKWSSYPLIGRSVGKFPPEPIRYFGAHVVRSAVARKEAAEIEDRKPSRIACAFANLAPAGLEDKE